MSYTANSAEGECKSDNYFLKYANNIGIRATVFFAQLYNVKTYSNFSTLKQVLHHTVVGDNINIMKTTFELNFDFLTSF